jgi:hypothetical protein
MIREISKYAGKVKPIDYTNSAAAKMAAGRLLRCRKHPCGRKPGFSVMACPETPQRGPGWHIASHFSMLRRIWI